jgi:hypothetical protein
VVFIGGVVVQARAESMARTIRSDKGGVAGASVKVVTSAVTGADNGSVVGWTVVRLLERDNVRALTVNADLTFQKQSFE